jgi:uncharacterized protein YggE
MKKRLVIFLLSVLSLSVVLTGTVPAASAMPPMQEMDSTIVRKITVSGSGTVSAEPDAAVLRLGVSTQAEKAAAALAQNNEDVQAVIDALVEAGIAEEDIETVRFNMYPRYGDQFSGDEPQQISGYEVSNVIRVHVAEIDQVGELLDVAVSAGANTVESIQFEISDSASLVDQAREAAMQNAADKAEKLAALAGAELGMVLEIQETGFTPGVVLQRDMAVEEAAAVPIQPGEQDVNVQLTVVWELQ